LRAIVTQPKNSFDLRKVMDEGKILLVSIAKGKIGEDTAALWGRSSFHGSASLC
jgi:hypothetical protein